MTRAELDCSTYFFFYFNFYSLTTTVGRSAIHLLSSEEGNRHFDSLVVLQYNSVVIFVFALLLLYIYINCCKTVIQCEEAQCWPPSATPD